MGFQQSWCSISAEMRFTVNLLTVRRDEGGSLIAQRPHCGAKHSASTLYGESVRSTRIGHLLEHREDKWWRVYEEQDMDRVRADVVIAIVEQGLPWLRNQVATI
ncbi:DUF4304 domain-containing protein [uncultured Microbacterium sp.]|uniref:DUF4304 domain-containing protein n=1 Tax=uncultured Microbacterium sp. TaxID=191216 RepID=UPI0025CED544|nr:DUF4304 domain-containing protein [Microbacterium sp.]